MENSWQDKQPFVGFFLWRGGGVLKGKKSADKLDLLRSGASAVSCEISSQSFSKKKRKGLGPAL